MSGPAEEEKEKIGKEVDGAIMEMTETCDKKMSEKEAKEKAATDATNGKAEDKADGNCVSSEVWSLISFPLTPYLFVFFHDRLE